MFDVFEFCSGHHKICLFRFRRFQKFITYFLSPLDDHLKGVRALLDLIARLGVGEVARLEKHHCDYTLVPIIIHAEFVGTKQYVAPGWMGEALSTIQAEPGQLI